MFNQTSWINTDEVKTVYSEEQEFIAEPVRGSEVMFLQYTSGSTGTPKGVIVTHDNVVANLSALYDALEVDKETVYISWLPYFHDMGLVGVILKAMYAGVPAVMMNPAYFLQKPLRWLQAISKYGGTISGAPNFAYDLCVDKIKEDDLKGIDLSSWKTAFNGAEPVTAKTLDRFCSRFQLYGFNQSAFFPSFGLAEATLFVSGKRQAAGPGFVSIDQPALLQGLVREADTDAASVDIVSCGISWHNHEMVIVDPATKERCAEDKVGELWIKGKSVAQGYWNKPDLSKETFGACLNNSDDGPYLRTGDLAFLLKGELYITGRLKDVLIIRGSNYYPQDLELCVWESHPDLSRSNTAVFSIDTKLGTQLVIAQEVQRTAIRNLQAGQVFEAIVSNISSAYQLPVFDILLLPPGGILKTSSGKIQRQANKQAYLNTEYRYLACWRQPTAASDTAHPEGHTVHEYGNEQYALENWIQKKLSELVGLPQENIRPDKDFHSFGLDSAGAIQLSGALQTYLEAEVPPGMVYDYPSIHLLAGQLVSKHKKIASAARVDTKGSDRDIAIIGISGRFPGAKDLEDFEKILFNGLNMITTPGVDAPTENEFRKVTYRAGYMPDTDLFDAGFFEIAPKEARAIDPQQRLILELCYVAMQHAGYAPQKLKGSGTGVFMGISNFDYAQLTLKHAQHKTAYYGTGVALSIAANRVSYFFDFKGPSLCIDTACSSSLVAVHQAVRSIRDGECTMALAGGVNLILSDTVNEYLDAGKLLAGDGHCKTFDASADGYVRGEGAGVILLKSKTQAVKDNDTILAIIKGSAVVQDGHSNGLLAPNGVSQQQVVQQALDDAGVQPAAVCYVEAHGTGTALGDPIEVSALDKVFSAGRDKNAPLIIGAVKANIGHLEPAAGIAGLIKTVICLRRKQIPPQLHFKKHNPNISWQNLCVKIPTAVLDINTAPQPLRAGVSSFGFGGTNAHVVLEEHIATTQAPTEMAVQPLPYSMVLLSGKTAEALAAQISVLDSFVHQSSDLNIHDLSFSLAEMRDHFTHRLAIKCNSIRELSNALKEAEQSSANPLSVVRAEPGLLQGRKAFLFTGGGAQYQGMADTLYAAQPVFKDAIDRCITLANDWMEVDLREVLFAQSGSVEETLLHRIDYMQPVLFAFEYAMSQLWMSWGIAPDVLIGHSLGEIVAACVAGVFSLEDGMKLICSRGQLMQSLPPGGVMISIQANEAEVKEAIADDIDLISVAVINGPYQTVIAGAKNAAERIKNLFDLKGVKTKTLQVSHASHSVLMDPVLEQYGKVLASITFSRPRYTLISNVTGKEADAGICTVQYWINHLRNTVRFSSGIEQLEVLGVHTFIEVGPHPVLLGIAQECTEVKECNLWLPSARSSDQSVIYDSLIRFYVAGGNADWEAFYKARPGQKITLPAYPFQKESYWIESTANTAGYAAYSGKPLLGYKVDVAGELDVYESLLDVRNFSYLSAHVVMGSMLVPASFFCDIVQAYIATLTPAKWVIEEMLFEKALMPQAGSIIRLQLHVQKGQEQQLPFTIHCAIGEKEALSWSVLVRGTLQISHTEENPARQLSDVKKEFAEVISVREFYNDFAARQMEYGAFFQPAEEIYRNKNAVLGKLRLHSSIHEAATTGYAMHPVLLDGSFQLLNALSDDAACAYLPFSVEGYHLIKNANGLLWAEVSLLENGQSGEIKSAKITLWNEQGEWIGGIQKLSVKKTDATILNNQLRQDHQYHLNWKAIKPDRKKEQQQLKGKWLIVANDTTTEKITAFTAALRQRGVQVILAQNNLVLSAAADINKVVFFWKSAAAENMSDLAESNALAGLSQLKELLLPVANNSLTLLDGYWWVTEGANAFTPEIVADPSLSVLWGLGRVFMQEQPDIPFKLLDVNYSGGIEDTANDMVELIGSQQPENELGLANGQIYGLRLAAGQYKQETLQKGAGRLSFSDAAGFESLSFVEANKMKPGENEVEIEVRYAGLNFRDIFRVLGLIETDKGELGGECSGVIVHVGASVKGFSVGDKVMALAEGSFANFVTTDYRLVAKVPDNITLREAATIPIAFLTAWYGFKNLADVQPNENVLIHSAAGGVGMAAIQIVHYLGGKVFGTASYPKWDEVSKLGVAHIYDSRTLDFYEQVLKATNGKGVDVVLNSFIDAFTDKSLDLLTKDGRFLEIGKRDMRDKNILAKSHPGINYAAYDLIYLMQHQQELISDMFALLVPLFGDKTFRPLPATYFTVQNAQEAFQFMSKAKHIGKVVLVVSEAGSQKETALQWSGQSTILITGALGGIGTVITEYLISKYKPGHLLLVGRKEPTSELFQLIQERWQTNVLVTTKTADVADSAALAEVIASIPAAYPLKGVVHLAGILDDAMIPDQDDTRFTKVMAPKVRGAWNLHELTKNSGLELFVLFSSAASVLGSAGQSNYAAANAFLDGLAHYRSQLGLPACSINWGPWESAGLVHRMGDEHKKRIRKQGIGLFSNAEAIALLDDALEKRPVQSVLLAIHKTRFSEIKHASFYQSASLLKDLLDSKKIETPEKHTEDWFEQLMSMNTTQRKQYLIDTLQQEVARILSVPDAKKIHVDKSMQEFGMDSLMAVELRNKLSAIIGKKLPVTLLFDYPNVLALAAFIEEFIEKNTKGQTSSREKPEAIGWREAVYHQLMTELKNKAPGDESTHHEAIKIMLDDLNLMMDKVVNGKPQENSDELDGMTPEELEDEFEKELKSI